MPKPLRLHFKPLHTDEQLWLVGMIAVLWSQVESTMDGHIAMLATAMKVEDPPDANNIAFKRRLKVWRRLIRQSPAPQERKAEIEAIIQRVADLQIDRNQAVHGVLGDHPTKGPQLMRSHPKRMAYTRPIDTETLRDIAEKMDRLLFDMVLKIVPKSSDLAPPPELAGLASPQKFR